MEAKKDFVKITIQDLELAENFFENEKHFNEFLINVFKYYRGKNVEIKTKIVRKYFENYKKVMDYIIAQKQLGKYGAQIKIENQQVNCNTLEGGLEGVLKSPLKEREKNKEKREKRKEERPNKETFIAFAVSKMHDINILEVGLKFDAWEAADWHTGNGKKILNWKSTLLNTLKYLGKSTNKTNYTPTQNNSW